MATLEQLEQVEAVIGASKQDVVDRYVEPWRNYLNEADAYLEQAMYLLAYHRAQRETDFEERERIAREQREAQRAKREAAARITVMMTNLSGLANRIAKLNPEDRMNLYRESGHITLQVIHLGHTMAWLTMKYFVESKTLHTMIAGKDQWKVDQSYEEDLTTYNGMSSPYEAMKGFAAVDTYLKENNDGS